MLMEISTMAIGKTIRLMALGNILTQMVPSMKATGLMINNMDKVKNTGQMALSMKEITNSGRRMDLANSYGPIDHLTAEISRIIIFMVMANIDGPTAENSAEIG